MKKFTNAEMEIVEFDTVDVITTSCPLYCGGEAEISGPPPTECNGVGNPGGPGCPDDGWDDEECQAD